MGRVFDSDGHLMADKLFDYIRWRERRGMTDKEIAAEWGVEVEAVQRAVTAARSKGKYVVAQNILIKKGIITDPAAPIKPKLYIVTEI